MGMRLKFVKTRSWVGPEYMSPVKNEKLEFYRKRKELNA